MEFYDTAFKVGDYEVELSSESDFGKATEILLNNFKNFFKQELSNILAWRLAKSVEVSINQNLIKEGKKVDIDSYRLNTTLIGDPIFVKNALVFPLDGSFIGSQSSVDSTEEYAQMPVFLQSENEPQIQVMFSERSLNSLLWQMHQNGKL